MDAGEKLVQRDLIEVLLRVQFFQRGADCGGFIAASREGGLQLVQPFLGEEVTKKTNLRDMPVFDKHVRCELAAGKAAFARDVKLRIVAKIPGPRVKRFRANLDDAVDIALRERIRLHIPQQVGEHDIPKREARQLPGQIVRDVGHALAHGLDAL